MSRQALRVVVALLALALAPVLAPSAPAGDNRSESTFGSTFFFSNPACKAKQIPTFESLAPVPGIVDPFERDLIPMFCQIDLFKEGKGVKNVKGKYTSDLIVRDNNTGELETFRVGSGRFKTGGNGQAAFDFDLPAELFADGFESGDVSAWSYTRTDFTNKKKVDNGNMSCGSSGSTSGSSAE